MSTHSHPRRRSVMAVMAATLLLAVFTLAGAAPAGAAAGDASAVGLLADVDVDVVTLSADISGSVGQVSAPPSETATLVGADATLASNPIFASLLASAVNTGASSEAGVGSSAFAEVTNAQLVLAGTVVIDASGTVIRAEADCPAGGTPTASANETLTLDVAGISTVLSVDGTTTVDLAPLGVVGSVTLDLNQTTVTSTTAAATALELSIDLSASGGALTASGDITIAQASCESLLVVPTATGITPDSGPTSGGTAVTITGTGFVPGETSVTIGGNVVAAGDVTVAGGGSSLDFTTPAHVEGPVDVTVTTPGGTSTPPLGFTYIPAPTTTGITPDSGPTSGGTAVTITGTGFVPGETSVTIGGNVVAAGDVTVAGDGSSLDFTTPAHAEGLVDVTVTTPGGTSTPPLGFTYVAPPAPTASTISPDSGPTSGGTAVTITGTGFVPGETSVTIGGNDVPAGDVTVAGDGSSLEFTTPAHAEGAVDVTVTTPGGTSTPPLGFTYVAPPAAPTATSLTPDEGPTTGGTTVTIDGSGFVEGETTVTIGGTVVPAADVTVGAGGTTLTFTTPAHAEGAVNVTVTTPGGTTPPLTFTYVDAPDAPPTATDTDPDQGPTTGGTTVIITGTGFVPGATTITIGGITIPATEVTVSPDGTSLSFVSPPHAAGEVAVSVTTPNGTVDAPPFTYVDSGNDGPGGDSIRPIRTVGSDDGSFGNGSGNGSGGDGGSLPRTGSDLGGLVMTGLAAVAGGLLLLGSRRRFAGSSGRIG